jgi:hypothetical protein
MKDKTFVILLVLFFLIFLTGIMAVTLDKPLSNLLKAANVAPSTDKSFGAVFPQVGTIGEENGPKKPTKIKVSVYMRDASGGVLSGRKVKLSPSPSDVTIDPSDTQNTNNIGQAEFFITSKKPGIIKFIATDTSTNIAISNIPSAEFTN